MSKLIINGGNKLNGELEISSSKNAYLPIIAGCILAGGEVVLHRYPDYTDTDNMCNILTHLGARTKKQDDCLVVNCENLSHYDIPTELAVVVRSSIFALGAIVSRFRKAKVAYPGGCEIGARPIDIHLSGLRQLGVKIVERHGYIYCDGKDMHSANIVLDFPSVGATENLMMASVLVKGETVLYNCAKEPEIVDLQNFLNTLGAKISGAGTDKIVIEGVKKLHGGEYTPIRDRIIAGTYMIACAMCGGDVTLKGVNPAFLHSLISKIDKYACQITCDYDKIRVQSSGKSVALGKVETAVYPGFPTDLQAQILALQTISSGSCMIVENLFESRFKHVPELIKMGASIHVKDRIALVKGVDKLFGADVMATDLRGSASLVLAGLVAEGYTTLSSTKYIDRGYEHIERELSLLGGDIKRVED